MKKISIIIMILSMSLLLFGCGKANVNSSSNSDIIKIGKFVDLNNVKKISVYPNDNEIVIKDEKDIKDICTVFNTLELKEKQNVDLEGGIKVIFTDLNGEVSIVLFEKEIRIADKMYSIEKDIIPEIERFYR